VGRRICFSASGSRPDQTATAKTEAAPDTETVLMGFASRISAYYAGKAIQGALTIGSPIIIFKLFGSAVFADVGFFGLLPTLLSVADQLLLNEIFASLNWSSSPCLVQWRRVRQTAALNIAYAVGISSLTALAIWLMHRVVGQSPRARGDNLAYLLLACSSSALWWSLGFWTNYAAAIDRPLLAQCVGVSGSLSRCLVPIVAFALRFKESIDTHLYVLNGIAAIVLLSMWAAYFANYQTASVRHCHDARASPTIFAHLWSLAKAKRFILLASFSTATYNMVDKVIFWSVLPKVLFGKYLLLSQLVGVVSLLAGPIYMAMVPVLNRSFNASRTLVFQRLLTKTLWGTILALALISLLCLVISDKILYRAFGHDSANEFLRLAYGTALSGYLASMALYVPWAVLCFRGQQQWGADIFGWICLAYVALGIVFFRAHLPGLILPTNMALSVIQSSLILRRLRAAVWGSQSSGLLFNCYPALMVLVTIPGALACWQNANWRPL
jgi:hypothetical protein